MSTVSGKMHQFTASQIEAEIEAWLRLAASDKVKLVEVKYKIFGTITALYWMLGYNWQEAGDKAEAAFKTKGIEL